jgi:NAD+ synthase
MGIEDRKGCVMTVQSKAFSAEVLKLDAAAETERIVTKLRGLVHDMRRKGAVLGLSGGIDSSVSAALCVRAFGPERVFGLQMPESDSADDTLYLSGLIAKSLGIGTVVENITPMLEAFGCYQRRDEAIKTVVREYGRGWKSKIVFPSVLEGQGYRIFSLVVQSPEGQQKRVRLPLEAYLAIVAATNFKQRVRKTLEYFHADRLNYAVAGTPNRLEYDQGFFVKNGDGSADVKPIAHLYKTQVYQLAEYLEVPAEIRKRPPTTDTYSLQQTQDEFYFSLSYHRMDICLYSRNHGISATDTATATGLTPQQVEHVFRDIDAKRTATRYQQLRPQLIEEVEEVCG